MAYKTAICNKDKCKFCPLRQQILDEVAKIFKGNGWREEVLDGILSVMDERLKEAIFEADKDPRAQAFFLLASIADAQGKRLEPIN